MKGHKNCVNIITTIQIQADLRDIAGLAPDHHNKVNTAINQVR